MKNMACYELRIVGNRDDYSDEKVRTLAVHAADIWEKRDVLRTRLRWLARGDR